MLPRIARLLVALVCLAFTAPATFAETGNDSEDRLMSETTVLGQLFCDDDDNGRRSDGEDGVGGVRIVADHGWQAVTDPSGRFHMGRLQPGQHLLKLDETSLPPWATPQGSSRRRLLATSGLVTSIQFPLDCKKITVAPERLDLGEKTPATTEAPLVTLSGSLEPLKLYFDGRPVAAVNAEMRIRRKGQKATRAMNTPWRPGIITPPIQFLTRTNVTEETKGTWQLQVSRLVADGQVPVRVFSGAGAPPKKIEWDGTDAAGARSVLERGALYTVLLRVTDGKGQAAVAPEASLGLSFGSDNAAIERRVLRGALLSDPETSTEEITRGLEGISNVLWANRGARVLVEVHTDDTTPTEVAVTRSRRDAFVLAERVREVLGLRSERVSGVGYGPTRPIRPNINETNRALNRRVEIAILPAEKAADLGPVPITPVKPGILAQGLRLPVGADLTFMRSIEERDGQVTISTQLPNGGRWHALVTLADLAPGPDTTPTVEDPLRHFGGKALREALGDALVASRVTTYDTAEELEVVLPDEGAVLQSPHLFVTGRAHPVNRITIGGAEVPTDSRGQFALTVPLRAGTQTLEVTSTDKAGRTARISRTLTVSDKAFFVLALGDIATGLPEAHLPGRTSDNAGVLGPVFIQGRGAAVFRGRMSGTALAEHIRMTAIVDTNKHSTFRSFLDQVIDPARDYAVYGDSAQSSQLGAARGPLYVLIEADASHAMAGNFRTQVEGLQLLRYNRAVYGGRVHFEHAWREGWRSQAQVFGTEDVSRLRRGHDELRATGGSLYYLASKTLVEGSEALTVVTREQGSGLILERRTLTRDVDYRIDYLDGRVHLKAPLSAVTAAGWGLSSFEVATERAVLQGHDVWLVADYETADPSATGEYAVGARINQELFGRAEVGGSFIQEGRSGDDYTLFGADTTVNVWEGTRLRAEFAGSMGRDGASLLSRDGGLAFTPYEAGEDRTSGYAFKLGVEAQPGKWFNADLDLQLRGWWELVDPGFQAAGRVLDQGKERFGGEAIYRPTELDELRVRVDGARWHSPNALLYGGDGMLHRYRYAARYSRQVGPVRLSTEAAFGEHRDDARGEVFHTGGFLLGARWQATDRLGLLLNQEALVGGDDEVLGVGFETRMTTRVGLDYQVMDDLALMLGTALRWDGDHAILLGARTRADDGTDVYIHEELRPSHHGKGGSSATIIGTERRLADGGRVYSEYRLGAGGSGLANRAVLGIAKRFELAPGVNLAAGYERSQAVGGVEGIGSRDVLSAGLEILAAENLRYGGRYEIRIDQLIDPPSGVFHDSGAGRSEVIQAVLSNGLTWRIAPELTALGTFRFVFSQDLVTRDMLRESMEGSAALLWRPRELNWLTLSARYSRIYRQWLEDVTQDERSNRTDTIGATALMSFSFGLTLTERVIFLHRDEAGTASSDELLWLTHAAFEVLWGIDIAAEYRMWVPFGGDLAHGALAEVGYTLMDHARIGVGYDFSSIPRDLSLDAESGMGGFFVRLTGTY
ncbi:MAG: hypothetical protein ACPGU1_03740 [Myxococcota bacterium]